MKIVWWRPISKKIVIDIHETNNHERVTNSLSLLSITFYDESGKLQKFVLDQKIFIRKSNNIMES